MRGGRRMRVCRDCKESFDLDDFDVMEGLCNNCYKKQWGNLPHREIEDANVLEGEE